MEFRLAIQCFGRIIEVFYMRETLDDMVCPCCGYSGYYIDRYDLYVTLECMSCGDEITIDVEDLEWMEETASYS